MQETKESIIKHLGLVPHPEGGFYRETYRSKGAIKQNSLPLGMEGRRNYSTAIYYLLTAGMFSAFHRIRQDEIWHFYLGAPLELHSISEAGELTTTIIGNNLDKQETPQLVVPGGSYFAARVLPPGDFSLAGCTVSPGFDFADFEMPAQGELLQLFPQHEALIRAYTRL